MHSETGIKALRVDNKNILCSQVVVFICAPDLSFFVLNFIIENYCSWQVTIYVLMFVYLFIYLYLRFSDFVALCIDGDFIDCFQAIATNSETL